MTMWRRLLTSIVCLLLVHATMLQAAAGTTFQSEKDYDPPLAVEAGEAALGAAGSESLAKILVRRTIQAQAADRPNANSYVAPLIKNLKRIEILNKVSTAVGIIGTGLAAWPGLERAWTALKNGDWSEATVQAAGIVELVGKAILKNAAGQWVGGWAASAAFGLCMALVVAAPVCIGAAVVAYGGASWGVGELIDVVLAPLEAPFCRNRRIATGECEPSPLFGPRLLAGPGGGGGHALNDGVVAAPPPPNIAAPNVAAAPASPAPGFTGGGGARVGSTSTSVNAKNLTAAANGAGSSAVNNIGSINSGSGRTSVSAQSITTTASTGQSATTNIGTSTGDTVVTGDTYNEGGDLTIGSSGTSRDGRKCIDVHRNTCIIHVYYRKHYSDPCAPGYWRVLNACKRPSDVKHSIPGL